MDPSPHFCHTWKQNYYFSTSLLWWRSPLVFRLGMAWDWKTCLLQLTWEVQSGLTGCLIDGTQGFDNTPHITPGEHWEMLCGRAEIKAFGNVFLFFFNVLWLYLLVSCDTKLVPPYLFTKSHLKSSFRQNILSHHTHADQPWTTPPLLHHEKWHKYFSMIMISSHIIHHQSWRSVTLLHKSKVSELKLAFYNQHRCLNSSWDSWCMFTGFKY